MELDNRKWREFKIDKVFEKIKNCKPYHKNNLSEAKDNGIPYVSRTNKNNGLESIIRDIGFFKNDKDAIVFGAESAIFFYHPYNYITGNKMYAIYDTNINKYSGLFIKKMLDKSIKNCGFGYGKGLTGSRLKNRFILLPVNKNGEPDYKFMEDYMKEKEQNLIKKYKDYISKRLDKLNDSLEVKPLAEKSWKEFNVTEIFSKIKRGKRLKKADHISGRMPYISSTSENNGIDNYLSNDENVRIFSDCLTLANSGSLGSCFYHPFKVVASDHVTRLKDNKLNKYSYLFISCILSRLGEKYSFNREISNKRLKRDKLLLPINKEKEPDYEYMENYMKNVEYRKIKEYLIEL